MLSFHNPPRIAIASLASEQYDTFAALLLRPQIKERDRSKPPALFLYTWAVMDENIAKHLPGMKGQYTPLSDHLYKILREPLRDFLPQDDRYTKYFDRFEYLLALVHSDLYEKMLSQSNLYQNQSPSFWGPIGSFGWRRDIISEIDLESSTVGADWLPLKAGLFNSSVQRFQLVQRGFDEHLRKTNFR